MAGSTLVFDLDGTLIDSAPDLQALLVPTLAAAGRRPLTLAETRDCIGWGMVKLVERAFTTTGAALDPDHHDAVVAEFRARYEASDPVHTKVYPGVPETLAALKPGRRIAMCTNKPARATARVLAAFDLLRFFDGISGGDSVAVHKPDPQHFWDAVSRAGGGAHAVMIGDSETDVATGRAAAVPTIAVSYGYAHEPPRSMGADRVIDRFPELVAVLDELAPRG
jgi:phosphoglycolate phosphatase